MAAMAGRARLSQRKDSGPKEKPVASIARSSGLFSAFGQQQGPGDVERRMASRDAAIRFANELTSAVSSNSLLSSSPSGGSVTEPWEYSSSNPRPGDIFGETPLPGASVSLEDVPFACFAVDESLKATGWNSDMVEMSGYPASEAVGRDITTGFSSHQQSLQQCLQAFISSESRSSLVVRDFTLHRQDQRRVPVLLRLKLQRSAFTGVILGVVVVVEEEQGLARGIGKEVLSKPSYCADSVSWQHERRASEHEVAEDYVGARALVVDPSSANRRIAVIMLERLGFESVVVAGVEEALARYGKDLMRGVQPFDVMLVDGAAGMGDGGDEEGGGGGSPSPAVLHCVSRARALEAGAGARELPVVMLSDVNHGDLAGSAASMTHAIETGISTILRKPVTSRALQQALDKVVCLASNRGQGSERSGSECSGEAMGGEREDSMAREEESSLVDGGVGEVALAAAAIKGHGGTVLTMPPRRRSRDPSDWLPHDPTP